MNKNVARKCLPTAIPLLSLGALLFGANALAAVFVFNGVDVINVDDGKTLVRQVLVVKDDRIVRMGPAAETPIPEDAEIIAAQGWTVIPGLHEMHAHIPPRSAGEQRAQDVLKLYLANGITTARGMLGEPWHLQLRQRLKEGEWSGPRLITSGPSFNGRSVGSAKQATRMVTAQAAAGYDFLKLHPGLGPMEYDAIAREAKKANIPFAGHVSTAVGIQRTLNARQATIDHLDGYAQSLLSEDSPLRDRDPGFFGIAIAGGLEPLRIPELATQTKLAGVWNVPTESLMENILGTTAVADLLARPEMAYVDTTTKNQWAQAVTSQRRAYSPNERQRFLAIRRQLIGALQDVGAGLLLGSDAPQIMNVPGFSIHQELALMVESGLSQQQALAMGTINAAQFFSELNYRGRVAESYIADLVFLRGNPLRDINHTRHVSGVYHQGQWYNRATLDQWLSEISQRMAE